ncbi:putative Ig domain-containing protein [Flavobacterium sp. HJJ]|uniref:putative Ig domain-containing protein n=1 Tax=Flavobacterium sp. HJJ TaxID=2783792 RepID=UPI00188DA02D|nr:putative Ig domain-containing protein [Flavobacterium sp. HJJ]MBF4472406.1 putative Ig domain-containing protein [Flavobacterium sp. HJJ]
MKNILAFFCCFFLIVAQAQDNDQSILTPKPGRFPKVNAVRVFGVRPNSEFIYKIPATGEGTLVYSVDNLPSGLSVDSRNGVITGVLKEKGDFTVVLKATNKLGSDKREMKIKVGDKICLTPPMGWNSWYSWSESVADDKIRKTAVAFEKLGLINYGWNYINIDDCWQGKREGKDFALQSNERFPDMKGLCNYVHSFGMKIGIYTTPWVSSYAGFTGGTCDNAEGNYDVFAISKEDRKQVNQISGSYPGVHRKNLSRIGEYWFLDKDAKQFAEWGFDFVKVDWKPNDIKTTKRFSEDLLGKGRDIVFSVSNNAPITNAEGLSAYSNLWRTTTDIEDKWEKVLSIVDTQFEWRPYVGPGHWSDPDMLQIGNFGTPNSFVKKTVPSKLTADEQYSQVSFWALQAAPLIISCNLDELDDFTLSLITNNEVIDIDQDPLGISADKFWLKSDEIRVMYKALFDGSIAVGIFNTTDLTKEYTLKLKEFHFLKKYKIRDVWRQKDLGEFSDEIKVSVNPHGVMLLKLSK